MVATSRSRLGRWCFRTRAWSVVSGCHRAGHQPVTNRSTQPSVTSLCHPPSPPAKCCIDEFDKIGCDHHCLLEAMEQQQVSIAKSGVVVLVLASMSNKT